MEAAAEDLDLRGGGAVGDETWESRSRRHRPPAGFARRREPAAAGEEEGKGGGGGGVVLGFRPSPQEATRAFPYFFLSGI